MIKTRSFPANFFSQRLDEKLTRAWKRHSLAKLFKNVSNSSGRLLNQISIKTPRNSYLTPFQTLSFHEPTAVQVLYIIIYPGEKGREVMGERTDFLKRERKKMCSWEGFIGDEGRKSMLKISYVKIYFKKMLQGTF